MVVVRQLKSVEQLVDMVPDRFKTTEADRQDILKEAHEIFKSLVNHSQFHPDDPKPPLSPPMFSPPSPLDLDDNE